MIFQQGRRPAPDLPHMRRFCKGAQNREDICYKGKSLLQPQHGRAGPDGAELYRCRGRPRRRHLPDAAGALCAAAGSGLRRPADPAGHDGSACPRAAVCLPRARYGYGAAGMAEYLYLPGGVEIQGAGLRGQGLRQLCRASAAQHDHARGHLCHHPCARDGASYAEAGRDGAGMLRGQGQYEPQLAGLPARDLHQPGPARHRALDLRDEGALCPRQAHPDPALHPVVHGRSDVRAGAAAGEIRPAGAEPSVGKLFGDRLDPRAVSALEELWRRV